MTHQRSNDLTITRGGLATGPIGGGEASTGRGGWIDYHNASRPHSVFDGRTPEEVYTGRDAPACARRYRCPTSDFLLLPITILLARNIGDLKPEGIVSPITQNQIVIACAFNFPAAGRWMTPFYPNIG